MPTYLAIDLEDFHATTKKWQRGEEDTVRLRVLGAKSLKQAKRNAVLDGGAWFVFPLGGTQHIVYANQKEVENVRS